MELSRKLLSIATLTMCIGSLSTKQLMAANYCPALHESMMDSCVATFQSCSAGGGTDCQEIEDTCFSNADALYEQCMKESDPGSSENVAFRNGISRTSLTTAVWSPLQRELSPQKITLGIKLN
jgi:hypothetical protein